MTPARTSYAEPASREIHLVEIVDPSGVPLGKTTVAESHLMPGRLHRAFSVLLTDNQGRLLLQRRAAVKTRFPLRWANTCCGHPGPGEDIQRAARTRLYDEMGVRVACLEETGRFVYRAEDPSTGRVEHEYDHVLLGRVSSDAEPVPDPYEVAEWRWVDAAELRHDVDRHPDQYAPWLPQVVQLAAT
ncbi:MAG: isopentenyl-diphosphate Delta-isomerase [Micromonosporaceae bacterium]